MKLLFACIAPFGPASKKNANKYNKKTGKVYKRGGYPKWQYQMLTFLNAAKTEHTRVKFPIKCEVHLRCSMYRKGIMLDLSNAVQGIEDCLEKIGILKNDRQIKSLDGTRIYADKNDPKIVIELFEFED